MNQNLLKQESKIYKMKNIISTSSILSIYEEVATDKNCNYNYHTQDNDLTLTNNFITELIPLYHNKIATMSWPVRTHAYYTS
jgi:hypothetical protein